jgi:hypothetical protein
VEVTTLSRSSVATHSAVVGHEIAKKALLPSTWDTLQLPAAVGLADTSTSPFWVTATHKLGEGHDMPEISLARENGG